MTQFAGLRGIARSVIDGVCHYVNRAINNNFQVFTTGRWMRASKNQVQVGGFNESVAIGKVRVNPRDIVVTDANNFVVVLQDGAREVVGVVRKIKQNKEASGK